MSDKDPDYVDSRCSYNQRIATKCRICGKQITHPIECREEVHEICLKNYKRKTW
jgi:hypothetical protein